jgi:prevent-host-death family protein
MANRYSIAEARDRLARLVHDAEKGIAVELTRLGKRVAVLVSMKDYQRFLAGKPSFWEALEIFRSQVDLKELGVEPVDFPRSLTWTKGRLVTARYLLDTTRKLARNADWRMGLMVTTNSQSSIVNPKSSIDLRDFYDELGGACGSGRIARAQSDRMFPRSQILGCHLEILLRRICDPIRREDDEPLTSVH